MVSLLIIFEFSDFAGHVMEGVWGSQVSQNQQKHAQSPYLDEYLRFLLIYTIAGLSPRIIDSAMQIWTKVSRFSIKI